MNYSALPLTAGMDAALHPRRRDVSTPEVTPDLLLRVAAAWEGSTASDDYVRNQMRAWAARLEREQRTLPTVPGWYPSIVVERGEEYCTGALLVDDGGWRTAHEVAGRYGHWLDSNPLTTIRWAEQDGKTPGQTLWEAETGEVGSDPDLVVPWGAVLVKARYERVAAAVLAAHGTPTLTDEERAEEYQQGWAAGHKAVEPASLVLTPVGEHPEPGTRGLLPVVVEDDEWSRSDNGSYFCMTGSETSYAILADPRPDGAHE